MPDYGFADDELNQNPNLRELLSGTHFFPLFFTLYLFIPVGATRVSDLALKKLITFSEISVQLIFVLLVCISSINR